MQSNSSVVLQFIEKGDKVKSGVWNPFGIG